METKQMYAIFGGIVPPERFIVGNRVFLDRLLLSCGDDKFIVLKIPYVENRPKMYLNFGQYTKDDLLTAIDLVFSDLGKQALEKTIESITMVDVMSEDYEDETKTRRQRHKARKEAKRRPTVTIASLFTSHWINGRACVICGPVYRDHNIGYHIGGNSADIVVIDDPFRG